MVLVSHRMLCAAKAELLLVRCRRGVGHGGGAVIRTDPSECGAMLWADRGADGERDDRRRRLRGEGPVAPSCRAVGVWSPG
jgi:hypothetical protein